jgi:hypothetical protein
MFPETIFEEATTDAGCVFRAKNGKEVGLRISRSANVEYVQGGPQCGLRQTAIHRNLDSGPEC